MKLVEEEELEKKKRLVVNDALYSSLDLDVKKEEKSEKVKKTKSERGEKSTKKVKIEEDSKKNNKKNGKEKSPTKNKGRSKSADQKRDKKSSKKEKEKKEEKDKKSEKDSKKNKKDPKEKDKSKKVNKTQPSEDLDHLSPGEMTERAKALAKRKNKKKATSNANTNTSSLPSLYKSKLQQKNRISRLGLSHIKRKKLDWSEQLGSLNTTKETQRNQALDSYMFNLSRMDRKAEHIDTQLKNSKMRLILLLEVSSTFS